MESRERTEIRAGAMVVVIVVLISIAVSLWQKSGIVSSLDLGVRTTTEENSQLEFVAQPVAENVKTPANNSPLSREELDTLEEVLNKK